MIITDTFEAAFLSSCFLIINSPDFSVDSRIGDTLEKINLSYCVKDMKSYIFENKQIGRLTYEYAAEFYDRMIKGCVDDSRLLEKYPHVARFLAKPTSPDLPANFNTFYGPRILTQLPAIIKELKSNNNTRRAVISILSAEDLLLLDKDESLEFPCCDSATFFIRNNKLHVQLHMRSQNMGQVLKLDMYLRARFTVELAEQLSLETGNFYSSIVSAHIYNKDIKYLKGLLNG